MLLGVKIIEFEGLGPAPFAGRMLACLLYTSPSPRD